MKDFFSKVTKVATEVGDQLSKKTEELGKKTEEVVEIQKLKNQVRTLEKENFGDMSRIGELIYGMYGKGEVLSTEITEICKEVETRDEEIKGLEDQVNELKGHKSCGSCGGHVDFSTPFCELCGEKLEEDSEFEVEYTYKEESIFEEEPIQEPTQEEK